MGDQWKDYLAASMVCDSNSRLVPTGLVYANPTDENILFINAGGEDPYVSVDSRMNILRDMCFDGGQVISRNRPIVEAGDYPFIYQSARSGTFCYKFNNLVPGEYLIDLHFAELFITDGPKGQRVFDVFVQDDKVLAGLDIFLLVGANRPLVLVGLLVIVKDDGVITVRFQGINGHPLVSGICLTKPQKVSVVADAKVVSQLDNIIEGAGQELHSPWKRQRILLDIFRLPLSTRHIQTAEPIQKLDYLLHHENKTIRREARKVVKHLNDIIEEEKSIPDSTTSETKTLFDMLRFLCGKRISGDITASQWMRMSLIIRKLLRISEYADSDLSFGSQMRLSMEFMIKEGSKEIQGPAQLLKEKVEQDKCKKKIRESVDVVKSCAEMLQNRMFLGWIGKKSLNDALKSLLALPTNRVRDTFISTGSTGYINYLANMEEGETKEISRMLLHQLSN